MNQYHHLISSDISMYHSTTDAKALLTKLKHEPTAALYSKLLTHSKIIVMQQIQPTLKNESLESLYSPNPLIASQLDYHRVYQHTLVDQEKSSRIISNYSKLKAVAEHAFSSAKENIKRGIRLFYEGLFGRAKEAFEKAEAALKDV